MKYNHPLINERGQVPAWTKFAWFHHTISSGTAWQMLLQDLLFHKTIFPVSFVSILMCDCWLSQVNNQTYARHTEDYMTDFWKWLLKKVGSKTVLTTPPNITNHDKLCTVEKLHEKGCSFHIVGGICILLSILLLNITLYVTLQWKKKSKK